jgi:phosphoglycerate dehydrogenase-like enzyme
MGEKPNLLITNSRVKEWLKVLPSRAKIFWLDELHETELDRILPSIDAVLVQAGWPDSLTPVRISQMSRLRFIQSGWAGVNHIPFEHLGERVVVSSNAGGFSSGVAEFALALLLAAAKRVVMLDRVMRTREFDTEHWDELAREVWQLKGRTLGVLGYGGIGRAVGSMASTLGMNLVAFSRRPSSSGDVLVLHGRRGLRRVLRTADAFVISLPLSRLTFGLIGMAELAVIKEDAIMVNVARAEIIDEEALYRHLVEHPGFTYATDVWHIKAGKETYSSKFPLMKLSNFIGTPHVAGGSTSLTGEPGEAAVENLIRYLKGEAPLNVVDRSEYAYSRNVPRRRLRPAP